MTIHHRPVPTPGQLIDHYMHYPDPTAVMTDSLGINSGPDSETLRERLALLDNASTTLKGEFIGIDSVIDHVMGSIRPWFVFPYLQQRPTVINLWGMTGTGKTSLVRRICELLGMSERFNPIDMGRKDGMYSDLLGTVARYNNGRQFVILLDEFQHARLIDSEGHEDNERDPMFSTVWTLLDSGRLPILRYDHELRSLDRSVSLFKLCIAMGVKGSKGLVTEGQDTFVRVMGSAKQEDLLDSVYDHDMINRLDKQRESTGLRLLQDLERSYILNLNPDRFTAGYQVDELADSLDEVGTIELMQSTLNSARMPMMIDCTKSLVFVAGNLDEAYVMAGNLSPDVPADIWVKLVRDIGPTEIREALTKRFRPEQIARLGNNHVIYPAMGSDQFREFIRQSVQRIADSVQAHHHVRLECGEGLLELIFREGVYPTQGFRPLISTVELLFGSRLPELIGDVILRYPDTDTVRIDFVEGKICSVFIGKGRELGKRLDTVPTTLSDRRCLRLDDEQAIVSVHEAGHVICGALLLDDIPDAVVSVTATGKLSGFTFLAGVDKPVHMKRLLHLTAAGLGGYVAERILFGDEGGTDGSGSDIVKTTARVRECLMSCGMGTPPVAFGVPEGEDPDTVPVQVADIDRLTMDFMGRAEQLARDLLTKEKALLLRMSGELFRKGSLDKAEMKAIIERHAGPDARTHVVHIPYAEMLTGSITGLLGE